MNSLPPGLGFCALLFSGGILLSACQQESPSQQSAAADSTSEAFSDDDVYVVVSQQPDCGGVEALQEYINNNPPEPFWPWTETEGKVFVQFVVSKEGEVVTPEVTRGVSEPLNTRALEAVQNLNCEPGVQEGQRVHVRMSLPVTF